MTTVLSSQMAADVAAWTCVIFWAVGALAAFGGLLWLALEVWFKVWKCAYNAAKVAQFTREGLQRERTKTEGKV